MSGDMERAREAIAEARARAEAEGNSLPAVLRYTEGPYIGTTVEAPLPRRIAEVLALCDVAEAAARLASGSDPAWWGEWTRNRDLDGKRHVRCLFCGRFGQGGGGAETVAHVDCPALALDAALAALGGAS